MEALFLQNEQTDFHFSKIRYFIQIIYIIPCIYSVYKVLYTEFSIQNFLNIKL